MGDDFTRLYVGDGVGDYHLNRFRIAFEPPASGKTAAALAGDLIDNFPAYLKSKFATVEFDRSFDGKKTLHFHGSAAPPIHDDWVVREWFDRNIGFTAQTLKREFFVAGDDVGSAVTPGVARYVVGLLWAPAMLGGPLFDIGAGAAAVHYNRMHFLAGRRSWRISPGSDFGLSGNAFVIETVAVERFSAEAYRAANAVMDMEGDIPDVWIAMLNNFVNKNGFKVATQSLKPRWIRKDRVDYVQLSFGGFYGMLADPEFQDTYRLYPTILPGDN